MIIRVAIILLALTAVVYPAQPAFHIMASCELNKFVSNHFQDERSYTAPISGILAHVVSDRFVGESGIEYQADIAIVRALIMYLATPDKKKDIFLWEAFCGLFPDIVDKGLGTSYFHRKDSNLIPISAGLTNLGEEFSVLLFVMELQ